MKALLPLLLLALLAASGQAASTAAAAVNTDSAAPLDPEAAKANSAVVAAPGSVLAAGDSASGDSKSSGDSESEESAAPYKVVCYYGSWAVYRWSDGKVDVEDINPLLCTHLIYTFAGLNVATHKIVSLDEYNDLYDNWGRGAYERFVGLKRRNPAAKTMLAIGGWNEGSEKYSEMTAVPAHRQIFVKSCVEFLHRFGFDGLDLDWEYPSQRGGNNQTDRDNFGHLVRELSDAFIPENLLLSAAVTPSRAIIDAAYHMSDLAQYLDILNVMTYDYHGPWDPFTGHVAPLYPSPLDVEHGDGYEFYSVNFTMHYFLSGGVPAEKIVMGLPMYGQGFTLDDPSQHGLYAPARQPMNACHYTGTAGFCGFAEICVMQQDGGWHIHTDTEQQSVYAYKGDVWVGYDDLTSVARKTAMIRELGLGGGMVWSVETDDLHNLCGLGTEYPFMTALWTGLNGDIPNPPTLPPPTPRPTTTGAPTTARPTAAPTARPTGPTAAPTSQPYHICKEAGLNPDPKQQCSPIFYECEDIGGNWRVTEFECSGQLVFDPTNHVCNWPQVVDVCQ